CAVRRVQPHDATDDTLAPRRFVPSEFPVLAVDVVHELRERRERRVLEAEPSQERLERASVPFMRVLRLEHVEAQLAWRRRVVLRRDESESRGGIDETANEPGTRDPIHMHTDACDPRVSSLPRLDGIGPACAGGG